MIWFQSVILFSSVMMFFVNVHRDFNGRKSKEPEGFRGFVASVLALIIGLVIQNGAGSFSEIITIVWK